jgi:Protein of unknown function (DUF3137)
MLHPYQDFRIFYNTMLHPELRFMEQKRRRLLRLAWLVLLAILMAIGLQIYVGIFVVTLLLLIPIGLGIAYIVFQAQTYLAEYKPRVVALILDFIDNDVNFNELSYQPGGKIDKNTFFASKIFTTAHDYAGEDLITGRVRETPFRMSELRVNEFSSARSKLDRVFHGIFLSADYQNLSLSGNILLLPDNNMKYLSRTERAFHLSGGRRVHGQTLPVFEAFFNTYATPDVNIRDVLSPEFQQELLDFRQKFQSMNRQKEIYLSIIGDDIYIALSQDKDLLEPSLLRSNVSYESAREFYDDIALLLDLVLRIDVMN